MMVGQPPYSILLLIRVTGFPQLLPPGSVNSTVNAQPRSFLFPRVFPFPSSGEGLNPAEN